MVFPRRSTPAPKGSFASRRTRARVLPFAGFPGGHDMKVGVVFPQTEIGPDPTAVADFARAAEETGYHHLVVYDHVLGAVPRGTGWIGYTHRDQFHEPFVLFGHLAAITRRLELVTGILVLPQRQTALVAKQAAEVDVLSGWSLRLGGGGGGDSGEYEGVGQGFHSPGARARGQDSGLRGLWGAEGRA